MNLKSKLLSKVRGSKYLSSVHLRILRVGLVPRYAFAHYFLNADGISSRMHLQNYYSIFFPEITTRAIARVWLHSKSGKLIAKKEFLLKPFGQIYLQLNDLVEDSLETEGMIYVDLKPPAAIRRKLKNLPRLDELVCQTPFWVSYQDSNENYMYVHSIESFRGRVFGVPWPLSLFTLNNDYEHAPWASWRLLDVALLEDLQVIVMNHGRREGSTSVKIIDGHGKQLWEEFLVLKSKESRRVRIPLGLISEWKADKSVNAIRVALDKLLTPNGKPYVLMKYGDGPQSLHHG